MSTTYNDVCREITLLSFVYIKISYSWSQCHAGWQVGFTRHIFNPSTLAKFCSHQYLSQHMRCSYLSDSRAPQALVSLCICTDSPEPSLLAYTKYGYSRRPRQIFKLLAMLDSSARAFVDDICAYAKSTKISCSGPYVVIYHHTDFWM